MVDTFRNKLARFIAPKVFAELAEQKLLIDTTVNQRVANILEKMDPFEPLLKEFHGIFNKEYEKPEDKLNEQSKVMLKMWGYQQRDDPSFKYITEFVINTQANETLKRAPVTPERIMYGRAQISGMILFIREVERLGLLWDDELTKNKESRFDESLSVE